METSHEKFFKNIHHLWHKLASNGKLEILMRLYHEEAILSSPLVPVLLGTTSTVLKGYSEIYSFLLKGIQHKLNDIVKFNRAGFYLIQDNLLIWEHTYQSAPNKKIILLETMEIRHNKIYQHRIYWC